MSMQPQRIAVKLPRRGGSTGSFDATPFIGFFHRAIQEASFEGVLIDVADYRHVPNGPSVMLVAHEVDYVIDDTSGELGLLVVRKRCEGAPFEELLQDTLRKALSAAVAIDDFEEGGLALSTESIEVQVFDRSVAANDAQGVEALRLALAPVIGELVDHAFEIQASPHPDPRRPLALIVRVDDPPSAGELLARLPPASTGPAAGRRPAPAQPEGGEAQCAWDISVEELKRMQDAGEKFGLIDVRESDEFRKANLGGQLIPLGSLADELSRLPKDERFVVHCRSGARSAKAVQTLRDAGFEDVWNVRGGILAWSDRIDPGVPKY